MVEQVLTEPFVANNLEMSDQRKMLIITGPNMGGKSTHETGRTYCSPCSNW